MSDIKSSHTPQADVERIRKSNLFDQEWYLKTYPDVVSLGMDPVEHYVKVGANMQRDPSPYFSSRFYKDTHPGVVKRDLNPLASHLYRKGQNADIEPDFHYVLWAASRVAPFSGHERSISLAEAYLPDNLKYTVAPLKANQALENGNEERWLSEVNSYLEQFKVAPLKLDANGPSLLSRMTSAPLASVANEIKISIIMPAWNAEETITYAAGSILRQTWQNLELIIVDDCSQDSTWSKVKEIATTDSRVKIFRNKLNLGPYVSKNIGLNHATGDYITGQDADDWAVPQRLENHMRTILASPRPKKASLGYMIRIRPDGYFGHIGKVTGFSLDGVCRKASISCMFERDTLKKNLGYWDTVRFGADSEMIARASNLLGEDFAELEQITMICLDLDTSLTNDPVHGVDKVLGVSPIRANYRQSWIQWHKHIMTPKNAYLDFPQQKRRYEAGKEMIVPHCDLQSNNLA